MVSQTYHRMIRNEKYAGNALQQKKYVSNHLTKVLKLNRGQLPMYYVEDTHEAIINEEIFRQAQVIYEHNKEKAATKSPTTQRYPFSSVLYCPHCGKNYKRKISHDRVSWNCATFLKEGKVVCHTKQIPEETLFEITTEVLGLLHFDETVFKKVIQEIIVPEFNILVFVFNDGDHIKRVWHDRPRSERWNDDLRQKAREREIQRRRENK